MVFDEDTSCSARRITRDTLEIPHWMKVLEHRYQRLHAKVVNGTVRFTANHNATDVPKRATDRLLKAHKPTNKQSSLITETAGYRSDLNPHHSREAVIEYEQNVADYSDETCVHSTIEEKVKESLKFNNINDSDAVSVCDQLGPSQGKYSGTRKSHFENDINETNADVSQTKGEHIFASTNELNARLLRSEHERSPDSTSKSSLYSGQNTNKFELCPDIIERSPDSTSKSSLYSGQNTNKFELCPDIICIENNNNTCADKKNVGTQLEVNVVQSINPPKDQEKKPELSANIEDDKPLESRADVGQEQTNQLAEKRRQNMHVRETTMINDKINRSFPLRVVEDDSLLRSKTSNASKRAVHKSANVLQSLRPLKVKESKQKRLVIFSQMSIEARLAINEMKQVNEIDSGNTSLNSSSCFCTSPGHSRQTRSSFRPNCASNHVRGGSLEQSRLDVRTGSEVLSPTRLPSSNWSATKNKHNFPVQSKVSSKMQRPTSLDGRAVNQPTNQQSSSRHLPHIGYHRVTHNMPIFHTPLPHIGNNTVPLSFRENTFEITPLNFDVRFHQFVPLPSENNEDPSADILQKSIQKCNQWLVRYIKK